jgi:hypothetical protein
VLSGAPRDGLAELGAGPATGARVDGLAGEGRPSAGAHHAAFGYAAVQPRLERRGGIPATVAGPNALAARSWQAGEAGSPKGDLGAWR